MKHAPHLPLVVYAAMAVAALGLWPLQPTDLGSVEQTAVVVAYNGLPAFPASAVSDAR